MRPLLIRNVTVLTMTGEGGKPEAIENGAVLVRGGRIEAVGPAGDVPAPQNARLVDGKGRFLIPGLVDAHVHLDHPSVLPLFVERGITTVLNMRGFPDVLRWRREIAAGKRAGPLIYTAGDIIESAPGTWEGFSLIDSARDARVLVRHQLRAGYDFIKVYHGIRSSHLRAIVKEARRAGRAVIGHAPEEASMRRATRLGLADFAHGMELLRGFDNTAQATRRSRDMAGRLAKRGAWVTPNLVYLDALARQQADPSTIPKDPGYGGLHPAMRQWFDPAHNPYAAQGRDYAAWNRRRLKAVSIVTKVLQETGVPMLTGSDALAAGVFPQSALFTEFTLLKEAGLTPEEILAMATVRAGEFIRTHIDHGARLGVIAPGARADLLLIAHDPRKKVITPRSVRLVAAAGRIVRGADGQGPRLRPVSAPPSGNVERAVSRIAALVEAGKLREARAVYDTARAARPGEILFHRFAFIQFVRPLLFDGKSVTTDKARLEKALIAYNMYTDTYPDLQIGHIRLAQTLAALGRCAEASVSLRRAATLSPGHPLIEETAGKCGD